jgi:hypothetical protein
LTIFEMLEKLETEIVSLQTRYQDLASALQHPAANGNGNAAEKQKRPRKQAKKKTGKSAKANKARKRGGASETARDFAQLELPVNEAGSEEAQQASRVLGKRQALGKSLVQLRKMSAWRNARSADE